MVDTKVYDALNKPTEIEKQQIVSFLYENLDEYGDKRMYIRNAIDYAVKDSASFGGFILVKHKEEKIKGVVIINRTGMEGYIPPNILVYIAVHRDHRGEGVGKDLMGSTIGLAKGDIALHVEKDNPAKFLYEKFGFTNPYLEMRRKE